MGAKDKMKNVAKKASKKVLSSIAINLVPILVPIILIFLVVASIFTSFLDVSAEIEKQEGTSFSSGIYGGTIQEKVWWALKDCGFSDEQVAAAMGNIEHESTFRADIVEYGYNENNGGIGLCQWTNNNRGSQGNNTNLKAFAAEQKSTWQDEDVQVKFLVTYLTGTGEATKFTGKSNIGRSYFGVYYPATSWEDYKLTGNVDNDIDYLTRAFLANYEGPGSEYADTSIGNRIAAAKKYYNEFHGKSKPSNGDGSLKDGDKAGIKGYYTSSSGKTYTLYVQDISSSPWYSIDGCFHCSLATIMSGFGSTDTPNLLSGFKYGSGCYGYQSDVSRVGCNVDTIGTGDIKSALKKGNPVMFFVCDGRTLTTDNGSVSHQGHWMVMMDYKNENGKDRVYIHDPWSTHTDYGWGDLDRITSVITTCYHIYKP